MKFLKAILLAGGASVLLGGAVHAADLPTKKTPPTPVATSCFDSF